MATETTATPRRRVSTRAAATEQLETGKARIVETRTKEFLEDAKKDDKQDTNPQATGTRAVPNVPPAFFISTGAGSHARNSLSHLVEVLQDDGEEIYIAVITRKADVFNDSFFFPCAFDQMFPPMQFSPQGMLLSFTTQITKFNNNSGGRFDIRICRTDGEPVDDAMLSNFVIANPPRAEQPQSVGGNADLNVLINFMRESQEQQQRFQQQLIQQLTQGSKQDRFTELAEQVLMKKLTEDSKPNNSADEMMMKMFTMPVMMETMAERFRAAMDAGKDGGASDDPTWLKLINSPFGEKIGERASGILEGLISIGAQMAQQKATVATPQPASTMPPMPTLPQQPQQPTHAPVVNSAHDQDQTEETADDMTQLIEEIIEELETENVFDDNNEFIKELETEFPLEAQFVAMLCKAETFESLSAKLVQKAPQAFEGIMEMSEDGQTPRLSQRGVMLENRLREFYEYYRNKP